MSIQVWADVGGTFTDCIVTDAGGTRTTKVLSTGVLRCQAEPTATANVLHIVPPAADLPDGFFDGAIVSVPDGDDRLAEIGTVDQFLTATSLLRIKSSSRDLTSLPGSVIQLDLQIEAPVLATRLLLGLPPDRPLPELSIRLGTTRGTNALLTRSGARSALVITSGFGDLLEIGEQNRPELFDLAIRKPQPLTRDIVEIDERLDAEGKVLRRLDAEQTRRRLAELRERGIDSLSICLLHAYVNDTHERAVEQIARELGFSGISRSSEVAPLIKLVSRAETTTLDAYLNPILAGYVARVWQQFGGPASCHLRLMTSGGNLVAPAAFRGRDSILSGPAGGVVALGHVAQSSGSSAAIGLDMGGTSTDVSRFEGRLGRRYESRVSGVRVLTPMMDIETVAAGGGSICDCREGRLFVGPESAGADPGPGCYGRGGPLTITDVNLLLGRIPSQRFPFPLDRLASERQLQRIADQLSGDGGSVGSLESLAEGFLQIAVTHMAEAVRSVSTAEGTDVRTMTLVGFGGAAGQHLCRVAAALGMTRILDHPHASVLSAVGMGLASVGRVVTHGVYDKLSTVTEDQFDRLIQAARADAIEQLSNENLRDQQPVVSLECDLRYQGTESTLALATEPTRTLATRFHAAHQKAFGYAREQHEIELVAVRCEATLPAASGSLNHHTGTDARPSQPTQLWHGANWIDAQLIDRASLAVGDVIEAPAMVVSDQSTLVIEPTWQATVLPDGTIELTPTAATADQATAAAMDAGADPVLLEVVARRLQGIADAMGEVLRRTAISVNVKERRDYSCAVFRGDGSLIANAPHVPVHLGAMGHTVRHLLNVFPRMSAGDCFLSNDPFAGGSHLPDVTVVTPVFCDQRAVKPDFFVASRAHHAEIGGRTPGSMPPDATSLAEEGVVIRDFALVKDGVSQESELRKLLAAGPYPSRTPGENIADIAAQQAAGIEGVRGLQRLAATYSVDTIDTLMGRLLSVAGNSIGRWIASLGESEMTFRDTLDDGTLICVTLRRRNERLEIDFAGTADVHPHGFNATPAIVTAAILYVLRCVCDSHLPLCDGVLRDIDVKIPAGLLNPPAHEDPRQCAAVVAGNVETSQRIVDVLLGAVHVAAASQGTMNNLLIGDETFGYYETIGGGSGATALSPGADAVHTHMTNTRITDPEVLESRLPIRLQRFAIRRGSGGAGKHRGGDGMIRELEFLRPLSVSLITGRRTTGPYGIDGGEAGAAGRNQLVRGGQITDLPPAVTIKVAPGDRLIIQTPGGGGWGKADR
jgi:5-oxoprolinase (ATP-hydrolysing)